LKTPNDLTVFTRTGRKEAYDKGQFLLPVAASGTIL